MSTQANLDLAQRKVVHDERVKERNRVQRLLIRPEMGALIGAVAIFIFFAIVAPPFRSPEPSPMSDPGSGGRKCPSFLYESAEELA